jgi:L,D-transpeptidase YcbB
MKIDTVNRVGMKMIAGTGFTFFQQTINFLLLVFKYSFLFILLFLLASHENANPKLGRTSFEFYSAEFRDVMQGSGHSIPISITGNDNASALINKFYLERQFMPAWTTNFEVNATFVELMDLLKNSYSYGLLPPSYNYSLLSRLEKDMGGLLSDKQKLETRVQLEQYATWAAISFMTNLAYGIRQQDTTDAYQSFLMNLPQYLTQQLEGNNLREGILKLQPDSRQYIRLQRAAARYMNRAKSDTAEYTAEELSLNEDLIARRLISQGYLDESFVNDSNAIQSALRGFQKAHCLEISGKADQSTVNTLRGDVKDDFYKIAINLDRLRKDELKKNTYILVNIPEFKLHYYDELGKCKDFNVIVGKEETPTPMLTSQIEWVIANPYWTVPQSISHNEILPLIKKDSLYLQRNRFSVVDDKSNPVDVSTIDWETLNPDDFAYWFKQDNQNSSLGAIKFLFPNEEAVYLHDTPSKKLFEKRIRTFSHGCVRVQNPEELAQMIISAYSESSGDLNIKSVIDKKAHKEIRIEKSLPIYIRYYSCTADSNGNLYFHPDIYTIDALAISELFGKTSWE